MLTSVWNSLQDSMAILDDAGRIVAVNAAWRSFAANNGWADPAAGLNCNYLELCDRVQGDELPLARAASAGIRQIISGAVPNFELEYPCHSPDQERWFLLRVTPSLKEGRSFAVLMHEDVTERHRSAWERQVTLELLSLVNLHADVHDLIEAAVRFFRAKSGCQAVGIRQRDGDDYPYYQASGFPEHFIRAENSLCSRDPSGALERDHLGHPVLSCMCGNVICGRFDPAKPFFSPAGSFWTNSTTELLASTTQADRLARTRNRCHGEGYESVALLPLRAGGQPLGLLQLNDRRKNRFTAPTIALWERLAGYLALALARARDREALRASKALLSESQHIAGLGSYVLNITTGLWTSSDVLDTLFGIAPDYNRTTEGWAALVHPDDRAMMVDYFAHDVIDQQKPFDKEYRIVRHTDQAQRWVHGMGRVERDAQGRPLRMCGTIQDITARKRADLEREMSIEILRRINACSSARQLAHEIVVLLQERLDCQAVGIRLRQGQDYPYVEARGFSREFLAAESSLCGTAPAPGSLPQLDCLCGSAICGPRPELKLFFTGHGSFWSNDAQAFCQGHPEIKPWIRGRCVADGYRSLALIPLRLGAERLGMLQLNDRRAGRFSPEQIVFLERMADHLAIAFAEFRTQESLKQSEEKYRRLTETIRDVVWTLDVASLRFLYVSPAVRQLLGVTPEELMAAPLDAPFGPAAGAQVRALIRRRVADFESGTMPPDHSYSEQLQYPRKDGSTVWIEVVAGIRRNEATGRIEIQGVSRDISERMAALLESARHRSAVARLARLNTMGQMATGIAHELNQPLTAIRNYAHYCQTTLDSGRQTAVKLPEALQKIDQAAARAAQIIQRLRDLARKRQTARSSWNLNQLITDSLNLMGPLLQRRQIQVQTHLAADLPPALVDHVQIEQVLVNLIQNAVDAMDEPPAAERVLVLRSLAMDDTLQIEVVDRGCGVAPDELPRIFEEFHTTKPEGLGLGLAISRNIVESHGGRLEAHPDPAGGMRFVIVLPLPKGL